MSIRKTVGSARWSQRAPHHPWQSVLGTLLGWVLVSLAGVATAQTAPRPYPDPGYRWLGVYAGGPEDSFDYFLCKLSLEETFPDKAGWWRNWKEASAKLLPGHRHDVFVIYCGEKEGNLDAARRRVDAWLKNEPGTPTYPELIPAVCLGEENLGSHNPVLDGLARHIRETYGIPVLQWYSDPLPPNPELTADGWIWDSYGWDSVRFRKHLMKFAVLRTPALCVPWAADPQDRKSTRLNSSHSSVSRMPSSA